MTEADALTAIKTECKILSDVFTDTELTYFLENNRTDDGTGTSVYVYNLNRAIYQALLSAITALPTSFSRGGVSSTRDDLKSLLKIYKLKGVGIGVVVRDISG